MDDIALEELPNLPRKGRIPILRRLAREWAMQILYQQDLQPTIAATELGDIRKWAAQYCGYNLTDVDKDTIRDRSAMLAEKVIENAKAIDGLLTKAAQHWTLSRMAVIDRNIMRVAVYEMCFDDEVPAAVAIDEALEISKDYGDESSSKFINGVLDRINRDQNKQTTPS